MSSVIRLSVLELYRESHIQGKPNIIHLYCVPNISRMQTYKPINIGAYEIDEECEDAFKHNADLKAISPALQSNEDAEKTHKNGLS